MIAISPAGSRRSLIIARDRVVSGTGFVPPIRAEIVELALLETKLSPRELAVRFTDEKIYFVSEASVYRLLQAHDLITSPAYIVIKPVRVQGQDGAEPTLAERLYLSEDHRLGLLLSLDDAR